MKKIVLIFIILSLAQLMPGCTKEIRTKTRDKNSVKSKKEDQNKNKSSLKHSIKKEPILEPKIIKNGSRSHNYVALTFDACEAKAKSGYDSKIVDVLTKYKAKTTFFLGGKWIDSHKKEAKSLAQNTLFEIANHSYSHPDYTKLSAVDIKRQTVSTQNAIKNVTGQKSKLFRFPYGKYDQNALVELSKMELRTIQWDVVTGDPDPSTKASDILQRVKDSARRGSIIIMHMNERGHHTADALPDVINYLRNKDLALVTVSELLKNTD